MNKKVQNILAQNSTGSIAYICAKCYKEVEKDAKVCKNCGAKLGNIRCPFCNFKGDESDFKNDTCPKCGRKSTDKETSLNIKNQKIEDKSMNFKSNLSQRYFLFLFVFLIFLLAGIIALFIYYFDLY